MRFMFKVLHKKFRTFVCKGPLAIARSLHAHTGIGIQHLKAYGPLDFPACQRSVSRTHGIRIDTLVEDCSWICSLFDIDYLEPTTMIEVAYEICTWFIARSFISCFPPNKSSDGV